MVDSPIDQQTPCGQELSSELIDSLIKPQTSCSQELLSELRTPQKNKLLVIRSPLDYLIHQQNPYNGSYHQILLTLRSTHKVMMVTFSLDD